MRLTVFLPIARPALVAALGGTLVGTLSGCAATLPNPDAETVLSGMQAKAVTARDAQQGRGPVGISNRFSEDGKMVSFVTLTWPEAHTAWGPQTFESRWYSGDRLVSKRETSLNITRSPYYLWTSIYPVALGPGPARYEVYANGLKLAETSFDVVAPKQMAVRSSD